MKKLFTLSVLILTNYACFAQDVIAVTNSTTSTFYTSLDSAVAHAQNGDYIYLPGGNFNVTNLVINKSVNVFGAGCNIDSTLATGMTTIVGNIVIKSGADGGSIQGLYVTGNISFGSSLADQVVNNYSISRCNLQILMLSFDGTSATTSTNLYLKENIIRGSVYGGYAHNVVFTKCFFQWDFQFFNGQVTVTNCVFLKNVCCAHTIATCSGVLFTNNVIREQSYVMDGTPGNTYLNNIFCNGSPIAGGNVSANNIVAVPPDSIFVNAPTAVYSYAFNYQLRASCAGNNAGTDGTDMGVYGTSEPFKAGSVPLNPHIRYKNIPSTTDGQGNLNINIRAGAQQQ